MEESKLLKEIQPHSQEYLTDIFKNAGYPSQFYSRFLLRYTSAFNDFKNQYDDCDESDLDCSLECIVEEVRQDALDIITEYSRIFMKEIKIGHGKNGLIWLLKKVCILINTMRQFIMLTENCLKRIKS